MRAIRAVKASINAACLVFISGAHNIDVYRDGRATLCNRFHAMLTVGQPHSPIRHLQEGDGVLRIPTAFLNPCLMLAHSEGLAFALAREIQFLENAGRNPRREGDDAIG